MADACTLLSWCDELAVKAAQLVGSSDTLLPNAGISPAPTQAASQKQNGFRRFHGRLPVRRGPRGLVVLILVRRRILCRCLLRDRNGSLEDVGQEV